ncbi:MAG: class I SAM-dependent methyltransferase [Cytophagales bacterium]|nr:class I SAM-dependent methyltransferase [Cytophagales bacterium]
MRKQYEKNNTLIEQQDYGANPKNRPQKISDIARKSVSSLRINAIYYKIIQYTRPEVIIELGTCLGINTLYMSHACPQARIYTMEGCSTLAGICSQNFINKNITLITGNIDDTIQPLLDKLKKIDFVLIDANHTYLATTRYFDEIASRTHQNSVIVIDDISWSSGMMRAWKYIKKHPKVTLNLDLFRFGIVFFNKNLSKQTVMLKY